MNRLDRFKKSTFSVAILCILLISLFFGYVSCTCSDGYVSYNCYGNILPCNGMFNLGSPTSYWDTIYVNNIVGWASPLGGNVTSIAGGTANTIPKFTSATNIENSSVTEAQVAGAVANSHTQNTDTILTTNGVIQLINAGLLKNDLKTDRWLNSDTNTFMGVGVVGDGNLAHTGGSEGYSNTAFGYHALESITSSYYNSAFGYYALKSLTTGLYNTGFGMMTLTDVTTGNYNTAVGLQALTKATGSYNTAIGLFAGSTNVVGDGNVFIGASAGQNELGSNKLYIANTNDATPLIYGDFGTNDLTVNGDLGVVGVIDANSNFIINVLDPLNAQDAATKNYVDTHAGAGSGNVTTITGGTANKVPKFTSSTNIASSKGTISIYSSGSKLNPILYSYLR